jgi:transposase
VEVYARVRRAVQVDGMCIRQAAREFGLARKTIRKMLAYSVPPGYERKKPVQRPKLGPWLGNTESFLEGHNQAFAYFSGVPRTILYDNTKIAWRRFGGMASGNQPKPSASCSRIIYSP